MLKTPHRRIMIGGVFVDTATFVSFGADPLADGAHIPTLDGGSLLQARYTDPVRPVSVAPAALSGRFEAAAEADYYLLKRLLSRGTPLVMFLGDYISETWLVSSDITTRRTSRRLPTGIPGLIATELIEARIDEDVATLVIAAPGPGEVQIPAAAGTLDYSEVITEDLLAAGKSWLTLTYAPVRRCLCRVVDRTEQFNNYGMDVEILAANA